MTKINRITIHGFKSFAHKTEVPLDNAFNCILGPNGSGKSNLSDAICFVLGRLSTKSMRVEKAANLIFNGGKKKQPASSAHVAIAKSGEVDTCVDERDTAYHAGRINAPVAPVLKKDLLGRIINPNLYTIGIECEGFRGDWFTEQQMVSVCEYIKAVAGRWVIPQTRRHIISHNEVTADKEDMRAWCDEIVRRLNIDTEPTPNAKQGMVGLLEKALNIAKNL